MTEPVSGDGQIPRRRPIRVVLADDEAMLRRGLRVLLERDGSVKVVAEAADGDELVTAVRLHRPDVALVDVQMPGRDGLAGLRAVQRLPNPPAMAVLTTFDLDSYVAEALKLGARGFLLKDAEPSMLTRAVLDLAGGGAVLDPRITARLLPKFRTMDAGSGAVGAVGGDASGSYEAQLLGTLSGRERQVLDLLGQGRSNSDIAAKLGLTEATVKSYVSTVLNKLGVDNRVQAALIAQRAGIEDPSR